MRSGATSWPAARVGASKKSPKRNITMPTPNRRQRQGFVPSSWFDMLSSTRSAGLRVSVGRSIARSGREMNGFGPCKATGSTWKSERVVFLAGVSGDYFCAAPEGQTGFVVVIRQIGPSGSRGPSDLRTAATLPPESMYQRRVRGQNMPSHPRKDLEHELQPELHHAAASRPDERIAGRDIGRA